MLLKTAIPYFSFLFGPFTNEINFVKQKTKNTKINIIEDSGSDTEELDLKEVTKEISFEEFSKKYKGAEGTILLKQEMKNAGIKLTKFKKETAIQKLYEQRRRKITRKSCMKFLVK